MFRRQILTNYQIQTPTNIIFKDQIEKKKISEESVKISKDKKRES
jgi:hypothetical protein